MTNLTETPCPWCKGKPLYEMYHDNEWGVPTTDDALLFEHLLLESFQAGLSWWVVLQRREAFARAFDNFNYERIALYNSQKIENLLTDSSIIRHRGKIQASVTNAQNFIKVQAQFGSFGTYLWSFVDGKVIDNSPLTPSDIPTTSPEAEALSSDLKKRGFRFLGPATVYAYMQAMGLINDHLRYCPARKVQGEKYSKALSR